MKYYSEITKEFYDTQKDCVKAEEAYNNKKSQKEARLKEVQDAETKYLELRDAFIKDYGIYYTKKTVRTAPDSLWDWLRS